MSTSGPCTDFPAPGLRDPFRYMSGHNAKGESVFVKTDHADHRSIMLGGAAAQAIFYSSGSNPIDLNGDADLEFIKNQPSLHIPNGCVVRMIDFAPGTESSLHRALTLGIGTVCEGEVELSLDSGEKRVLRPGDVSVNRGAMHRWRNTSKETSARMLFIMLDIKPLVVNGKTMEFEMGVLMDEYAKYKEGEGPNSGK
ncbi:cupin domain-containing protein [Xylaria sp. CBS 124048]|nr:cupin domain-containing protein [Xylaria sp. CBS 124048]